MLAKDELIPHLFRTEYSKIVSVLCKRFGITQIEIAEDIATDTFLAAYQTWTFKGIPENPIGWLYAVARNKFGSYLRRRSLYHSKISMGLPTDVSYEEDIDLSEKNIKDSQLQMMFVICDPSISTEAQIGLSLRILCGFSIDEIAVAFLTNKDTIYKRLQRAKEKLRDAKINISLPLGKEVAERIKPVLATIYLLFNEGYYSVTDESLIRKDFCFEALRLCNMLCENPATDLPETNALLALMCFQASRLNARLSYNKEFILFDEQDKLLWNKELISHGGFFLNKASTGNNLSKYHLQASIAFQGMCVDESKEKWEQIIRLYNILLQIEYSPIAALNRAYALAKTEGKPKAILIAEQLNLRDNQFYFALMGELYTDIDNAKAQNNFLQAKLLAKTTIDKNFLQKKIDCLESH